MTEYQIVDLVLQVTAKQDALWAVFFSVHMAIFGGIIYVDRPLQRTEKTFAIAAYLIFALLNYVAVRAGQRLLSALRADLGEIGERQGEITEAGVLFQASARLGVFQEAFATGVHAIAALLIIAAIILDGARAPTGAEDDLLPDQKR